jgi:hypothetical protein
MLTDGEIEERVLGAYDHSHIKYMDSYSEGQSGAKPFRNRLDSPKKINKAVTRFLKQFDLPVLHSKNLDVLGELVSDGVSLAIRIRPKNHFRAPLFYDMVLLHEIFHALYNANKQRAGVTKWCRNNVHGVNVQPARAIEEIIVELAALKIVAAFDEINPRYFGPSLLYVRERLSDLSRFGLSWSQYSETLRYCLKKASLLALCFTEVAF